MEQKNAILDLFHEYKEADERVHFEDFVLMMEEHGVRPSRVQISEACRDEKPRNFNYRLDRFNYDCWNDMHPQQLSDSELRGLL